MINSEKGFATILLMSLFPLLLAGGLAVFCTFGFLKSDLATLNLCRASQLEVQNKVGRNLTKLLKMNPQALRLRIAQAKAEKALAAAIESGNPAAIAAAEAYLLTVQMRRQTLDGRQRALISTADLWLATGSTELQRNLRREWHRHSDPVSSWLQGTLQLSSASVPVLAVQGDLPEVAPVYLTKADFAEAQAWMQSWRVSFRTVSWAQNFFKFTGGFDRSCTTSLYPAGEGWDARMKKDKSLLRGFL